MRSLHTGLMGLVAAAGMAAVRSSSDPFVVDADRGAMPLRLAPMEWRGGARKGSRKHEDRSRYTPHQGERECARRRRQLAKSAGTPA